MMKRLNYILGVAEQIIVSGGNFTFAILLSKLLAPNDFGMYSIVWMAIISAASFVNAWFSSPMLSISPSLSQSGSDHFISSLTKKMLLFQMVVLFAWVLVFNFRGQSLRSEAIFLGLSCIPFFLYDFLRRVAVVRNEMKHLVVIDVLLYSFLILGCLYLSNGDFLSISIIICLSYFLASLALLIVFKPTWRASSDSVNLIKHETSAVWPRHISFAKWASYSSVLQFTSGNAVVLFSATLLSLADVGLLRLAQTFVSIFNPVLVFLDNHGRVFFAQTLRDSGLQALNDGFRSFSLRVVVACVLLCTFLGLLGIPIINYSYPELVDTEIGIYYFLFLVLIFFTVATYIFRLRLLVLEHSKRVFKSYLISAAVSLTMVYPAVLNFGGQGVVYTLITTQLCILLYLMLSYNWPTIEGSLNVH
jgi:O-antigen/teichoic acid export membrane protein